MADAKEDLLDNDSNPTQPTEIHSINQAALSEITNLLEKQLEFFEQEKAEEIEKEKELQQEQQELNELEQTEKLDQAETIDTILNNTNLTTIYLDDLSQQMVVLNQNLQTIIDNQNSQKNISVESGWMITLAIVLAVSIKVFWDNVLKW